MLNILTIHSTTNPSVDKKVKNLPRHKLFKNAWLKNVIPKTIKVTLTRSNKRLRSLSLFKVMNSQLVISNPTLELTLLTTKVVNGN